jgi:hypothetical protein
MIKMIASAVFVLIGLAAIWAVNAPVYAAERKSGVEQADKSQQECIAKRQREGLNTRFAASRCVNPNN